MQPVSHPKQANNLFQINRANLRKVFSRHYPKDNKISAKQFLLFAKNVNLYPDLLSLMDIKRFLKPYKSLSFRDFQTVLSQIAYNSFNSDIATPQKIRLLLVHTRNSFKMHYFVNMISTRHKSSSPVISDNSILSQNQKRSSEMTPNQPYRRGYSRPIQQKTSPNLVSPRPRQKKSFSPFSQTFKNLVARNRMLVANQYQRGFKKSQFDLDLSDCLQKETKSPEPSEINRAFSKFRETHSSILNQPKQIRNQMLVAKQAKYIQSLKKRMFSSEFVKRLCFVEWRRFIEKTKRHRTNPFLF